MRNILFVEVLFLAVFACGPAFGQGAAPRPETDAVAVPATDGKTAAAATTDNAPRPTAKCE